MQTATERLWRTSDGRLVRDGDEDGQFLAYAPGNPVADKDAHLIPGTEKEAEMVPTPDGEHPEPAQPEQPEPVKQPRLSASKAAVKPADKQAAKPDDK